MGFLANVIRDGRGPAPRAPTGDGAPVDRHVAVPLDPAPPPTQLSEEEPFGADPYQRHASNTEGEYREEGAGDTAGAFGGEGETAVGHDVDTVDTGPAPPSTTPDNLAAGSRKVVGPSPPSASEESDGPAWDLPVRRIDDYRGTGSQQSSAGSQANAETVSAAKGAERSDDAATTGHPGTATPPVSPPPSASRAGVPAERDTSGRSPPDPVEARDSGAGDGSEPRAPDPEGAARAPARHTDPTGHHDARDVDAVEPDRADDPESVSAISPPASAPPVGPTEIATPSSPTHPGATDPSRSTRVPPEHELLGAASASQQHPPGADSHVELRREPESDGVGHPLGVPDAAESHPSAGDTPPPPMRTPLARARAPRPAADRSTSGTPDTRFGSARTRRPLDAPQSSQERSNAAADPETNPASVAGRRADVGPPDRPSGVARSSLSGAPGLTASGGTDRPGATPAASPRGVSHSEVAVGVATTQAESVPALRHDRKGREVPAAARPGSSPSPFPAEPRVHIGQIDVIVTAPPPSTRPTAARAAPPPDLSSRLYLRNL